MLTTGMCLEEVGFLIQLKVKLKKEISRFCITVTFLHTISAATFDPRPARTCTSDPSIPLPNARKISSVFHPRDVILDSNVREELLFQNITVRKYNKHKTHNYQLWIFALIFQSTLMVMQFGQFLAHDISLTPVVGVNNCCTEDAASVIPGCFPILLPQLDPTFMGCNQKLLGSRNSRLFLFPFIFY